MERPRTIAVVEECPGHHAAVAGLLRAAFGGEDEARLVGRLRRDGLAALSLVAVEGDPAEAGAVVGHILFSPLEVEVDGRPVRAVALAPLAVRHDRQGRGIGSRLIADGLAALPGRGWTAVIVLGHPGYYPRFGFDAALAAKLDSPFPGDAFMALELEPGALAGQAGRVRYPAAFGIG